MIENYALDGKSVNLPIESQEFRITLDFERDGLELQQPDLEIDSLNFTGDALNYIKESQELNGHFKKVNIDITLSSSNVFNGYLSDISYLLDDDIIRSKINANEGLNALNEKLSGITSLLIEKSYTTQTMSYVVEQTAEQERKDLANLSLAGATYGYILIQQIKQVSDYIAEVSTPDVLDALTPLQLVLKGINLIVSTVATAVTLGKYINEAKELVLPPVKKTKVISLRELIEKPLKKLGYELQTNIGNLDKVYHWASRTANKNSYVPNPNDYYYNANNVFQEVLLKYDANIMIKDNVVYLYQKEDEFWKNNITETLEDIPLNNYELNINEHILAREINYKEDFTERWTVDDNKGNHYLTESNIADSRNSTAKGFVSTNYNVARTSRKSKLNLVEKGFEKFVKIHNKVMKTLDGSDSKFQIPSRIGVARISNEQFEVAKLVYLEGGKIPSNHLDHLSAKSDEINFHLNKSFVRGKNKLRYVYKNRDIKFNFDKFIKILNKPYFKTVDGRTGKFTRITWVNGQDSAEADFYVINEYKTELIEKFYENI